jgi:glycosyltransferase involved in cell wall biosynthesis
VNRPDSNPHDVAPACWNVCVEHQPAHAGLYRGIRDFAQALPGGILSFDGSLREPPHDPPAPLVRRVRCGEGWLNRRCQALAPGAIDAADAVVADADILVVHSLFRVHCKWARGWSQRHRKPYWAVPHGCLDPQGMARRGIWKRLWMASQGTAFLRDAAHVIFATRRERDKARPWLQIDRTANHALVIHWPVHMPAIARRDSARGGVRRGLGIDDDARILLFAGRLHSTKRVLETVEVFCAANPSGCHLVIAGMDGDLTAGLVNAAVPTGFQRRVHVVGELSGMELSDMWLAADGYISLSMKENFGYSAAEALAHGLPVILSPGHDLAAELPRKNGRLGCGWLLPDEKRSSAIQAITEWSETLLSSGMAAARARPMQDSGRAWAADNLSFEQFRDRLLALATGREPVATDQHTR